MWCHKSLIYSCFSIACRIYSDRSQFCVLGRKRDGQDNIYSLVTVCVKYLKSSYTCIASSHDFDQSKNEYIWFEAELTFARERSKLSSTYERWIGQTIPLWTWIFLDPFGWTVSKILEFLLCFLLLFLVFTFSPFNFSLSPVLSVVE